MLELAPSRSIAEAAAMTRTKAIAGSIIFFVIAPVTAGGLVPWWISGWRAGPSLLGFEPLRYFGGAMVVAGLPVLINSFARFALEGLGTPAPIAPPRHLVIRGPYRYVRNPIYVAILAIVFGQALVFGSLDLVAYGAIFWLACHLFVVFYEEPTLHGRFGAEYEGFCASVPRWLPHPKPWRPVKRP